MTRSSEGTRDVWAAIDADRRQDRTLRRVSLAAWIVTFIAVLIYASIIILQILDVRRLVAVGIAPEQTVFLTALPLVGVVGVLAVLIGTLATVGLFLRMRAASLHEIQQRLAALENALLQRPDLDQ